MIRTLVKLEDILEVNPSSWSKKEGWTYLRYLDTANITNGRIDEIVTFDTKTDKIPSRARRIVQNGDFVYSTVRPNQKHFGLLKNIEDNLVVSTGFAVLRSKYPEDFDTRFIYLLVTQDFITNYLHGIAENNTSAYPALRPQDITDLEFEIPPISDQKLIADFIENLDDKIELNQKMNQTLEDIAKAIFKSWFVDFDPVRAKAGGRPTGLPPEISDLFPDELVDSEIGEIPKGWEVTPLQECAIEIESGRRPKGGINKSLQQGIPSVGAESIASAGMFDFSKVKYVTAEFAEKMKKGRVQNFDVALYKDGGKPGQFIPRVGIYGNGFPFDHFYVNEHVFLLRSEQLDQPFLYRLVSSPAFLDQLIAKGSAKAAQPGLNQTEVVESTFVCPNEDAIAVFNNKTRPLLERQFLLGKENEILSDLRDTLLPKLISGELRIPDAEKFLEEAGL